MAEEPKDTETFQLKICKSCHMGVLKNHQELVYWFKCEICGWCVLDPKLLHPLQREAAEKDKFRKWFK